MIKTIQEVGKRKKEQESEGQGVNAKRKSSIERIENLLRKRNVKAEELKPNNRDYKKVINDTEESEIIDVEERIKDDIVMKERENDDEEIGQQEVVVNGVKYNVKGS